jgi:signal transduction histidine kinase/AraC-like DNA-binding protein
MTACVSLKCLMIKTFITKLLFGNPAVGFGPTRLVGIIPTRNVSAVLGQCVGALLAIWLACPVFSQGPSAVYTHVLTDEVQGKVSFVDSLYLLLDPQGTYTIHQVIADAELPFVRPPLDTDTDRPMVVWSRLVIKNNGQATRHEYFSFCLDADTSWIYTVSDGQVIDQQFTGRRLKPDLRSIPSIYAYSSVSLDPGETKTFYFKFVFSKAVAPFHYSHLYMQPAQPLLHRTISNYVWQAFYAGIMLLFGVVGLFMFWVFREKSYVYFALVTLFFGLYFVHHQGMTDVFFTTWFRDRGVSMGQLINSGIIGFLFLFTSRFLILKERFPRYYRLFLWFTLANVIYAHVAYLCGLHPAFVIYSQNILLVAWVLVCLAPIVYLAYKKEKKAKILLLSIGILAIGVVVFLISFQNISPSNTWMRYGFQFGTIIFTGILFYALFDNINFILNEKRVIEETSRLKSNFFSNISHEFRTPLTLMMGPLQQLSERLKDPEDIELAAMAHRHATRQLRLVNQLLDLSRIDAGKMQLQSSSEDIITLVRGIAGAYDSLARQKGIALEVYYPSTPLTVSLDRDKVEAVMYNLLSNAFRFTGHGGQITVSVLRKADQVLVEVRDTGRGIEAEKLPFIFDRYFQAESAREDGTDGSGIGLALVKELVQLHGGTIDVQSAYGKGTFFTLRLPIVDPNLAGAPSFTPPAKLTAPAFMETSVPPSPRKGGQADSVPKSGTRNPHVLVIDDNVDVRRFIRLRLQEAFRITEASDGDRGIEKAIQLIPDLIISDVMMPGKDGFEVCRLLKEDVRTAHIPIILLTARATREDKLTGLDTGADDYLSKPFDSLELQVRAENLIRQRRLLRQRFTSSSTVKPAEVVTNSIDQAFLEEALKLLEHNMADSNFNIDTLARDLAMSRANLNRKLRALTGMSSNQFIQTMRLQRATDMLRQQAGSVAEIAYMTGFNSPAYFSKCFKDAYGQSPGNFAKKVQE